MAESGRPGTGSRRVPPLVAGVVVAAIAALVLGAAIAALVVGAIAARVLGAASFYLVERPARGLLRRLESRARVPGRPGQYHETVQPRVDGLNSAGVAVDHLA